MKINPGMSALITGGASGIGLGIAKVLTDAGVKVVLADINIEGAEAAAAELTAGGAAAFATKLDVTDPASWTSALADAESKVGSIQIFCNNAGVAGVLDKPLKDISDKAWTWSRSINLDGVFYGVRALVPHMRAHGLPSHIVNTGSIASYLVYPSMGDYTATKFGVAGLTDTLREELEADNIDVSLLCPGYARTSIMENSQKAMASFGDAQAPAAETEAQEEAAESGREDDAELLNQGMDPIDVGKFVYQGIIGNSPYIFTNPDEHREPIRTRFDAVMKSIDWSENVAKAAIY